MVAPSYRCPGNQGTFWIPEEPMKMKEPFQGVYTGVHRGPRYPSGVQGINPGVQGINPGVQGIHPELGYPESAERMFPVNPEPGFPHAQD